MARVYPSPAQWTAARKIYESNPDITLREIGDSIGTSISAVESRIKRSGWNKAERITSPASLANDSADRALLEEIEKNTVDSSKRESSAQNFHSERSDNPLDGVDPHRAAMLPTEPRVVTSSVEAAEASIAAANAMRAELVRTHRKEWHAVRQLAYAAVKTKDQEHARHLKTVAEAFKIIQEGERKAWGMDLEDRGRPPSVTVNITRRGGVTVG